MSKAEYEKQIADLESAQIAALESALRERTVEVAQLSRKVKSHQRDLTKLSDHVLLFLHWLDQEMKRPSTVDRGRRVARASNALDNANDSIRYNCLAVDFRNDDKQKAVKRLLKKYKINLSDHEQPDKKPGNK